jgi:hypothetical protein
MSRLPFSPATGSEIVLPADAARAVGRFADRPGCFGYQASNLLDAPLRQTRAAAEGDYLAVLCIPGSIQCGELRYVRSDVNDAGVNTVDLVDDVHRYTVRDDGTFSARPVLTDEACRLAHVEDQRMKAVEALVAAGNVGGQKLAGNLQRDAADVIAAIMHLFGHDGAEVLVLAKLQYESELV